MTPQEFKDLQHLEELSKNAYKIELAQHILKSLYGTDLNTHLKDAIKSLELARRANHTYLCSASDRVYRS